MSKQSGRVITSGKAFRARQLGDCRHVTPTKQGLEKDRTEIRLAKWRAECRRGVWLNYEPPRVRHSLLVALSFSLPDRSVDLSFQENRGERVFPRSLCRARAIYGSTLSKHVSSFQVERTLAFWWGRRWSTASG